MKKNLLSIVILSLLVVNIALTAVMMFSVMKTNQKTASIVTDIAEILSLELDTEGGTGEGPTVSLADTEVYSIQDSMTVTLKRDATDTADHYCVVNVSFSLNTTHEDYETYKDLSTKESLIKSKIIEVISSYSLTEAQVATEQMADEILKKVQEMYGSDFIYDVSFSSIIFS